MTYLDKICDYKKEELASQQRRISLGDVRAKATDQAAARNFRAHVVDVAEQGPSIIAEAKKASPSQGLIVPDFDPVAIAHQYEDDGAAAISVLTDEHFFQGQLSYLADVKASVALPVLRKDFTLHEYHIYEARAAQADAILLITRILDKNQLVEYRHLADDLSMSTLIEVHDLDDVQKVLDDRSLTEFANSLVGINSRNLETFQTDLAVAEDLRQKIPAELPVVAESGIHQRSDVERLQAANMNIFLVGEALLMARDPGEKLRELIGGS